jgi:hypothetical protein
MGSRHIHQRGRRRILVEIGNSRLVDSLLANHGSPPGPDDADPPFPPIPQALIPAFFRGLLDAAGQINLTEIRCWGSPRLIEGLSHVITISTGQEATGIVNDGKRKIVFWRGIVEMLALRRWLASPG